VKKELPSSPLSRVKKDIFPSPAPSSSFPSVQSTPSLSPLPLAQSGEGRGEVEEKGESVITEFKKEGKNDTVGAICIDANGNVSAGVSSGGLWMKIPGSLFFLLSSFFFPLPLSFTPSPLLDLFLLLSILIVFCDQMFIFHFHFVRLCFGCVFVMFGLVVC
jgi:Asparaginase